MTVKLIIMEVQMRLSYDGDALAHEAEMEAKGRLMGVTGVRRVVHMPHLDIVERIDRIMETDNG